MQDGSGGRRVTTDLRAEQTRLLIEHERMLLASIFRTPAVWREVEVEIQQGDFTAGSHAAIWLGMKRATECGVDISAFAVADALRPSGQFPDVVTTAMLVDLSELLATGANAMHHARSMLEIRNRMRIGQELSDLAIAANEGRDTLAGVIESIEKALAATAVRRTRADTIPIATACNEALAIIDARRKNQFSAGGFSTGYYPLDNQVGGLKPSDLIIIAARPSIGKTSLAMNIAENIASEGETRVLVFSLEMSRQQLAERMLARRARVDSSKLRQGRIEDGDLKSLADAACDIGATGMYVADAPVVTLSTIASLCRRIKARGGLDVVFVDYLQLIANETRGMPRQEQVADYSRRLKLLAVELKCCVVVMSQLNRDAEKREGNIPRLSDLRESGAIEQDADSVWLIHRPEFYRQSDRPGEADVIVAKQRNGPVGCVTLAFRAEYSSFENPKFGVHDGQF